MPFMQRPGNCRRTSRHIELIASENWVSKAVMAAMGSPLTNKYAEGYPGHRYYGGCDCVDIVEELARERAKMIDKTGAEIVTTICPFCQTNITDGLKEEGLDDIKVINLIELLARAYE